MQFDRKKIKKEYYSRDSNFRSDENHWTLPFHTLNSTYTKIYIFNLNAVKGKLSNILCSKFLNINKYIFFLIYILLLTTSS